MSEGGPTPSLQVIPDSASDDSDDFKFQRREILAWLDECTEGTHTLKGIRTSFDWSQKQASHDSIIPIFFCAILMFKKGK